MKAILHIIKILCYLLSFPLFMICAIVAAMPAVKAGGSYGIMGYVGIILPIVFSVIWAVCVLVFELKIKKSTVNKKQKIKKQTVKMVIASFCLTSGLMLILGLLLPGFLPGPTSGTLFYEDLADGAVDQADTQKQLLDNIIGRSVITGIVGKGYPAGNYYQVFSYYKTDNEKGPYTGYPVDAANNKLIMSKYGYYVTLDSYNANLADADPANDYDGTASQPVVLTAAEVETEKAYFLKKIEWYTEQGVKNEEVNALVAHDSDKNLFASINLSGYETFLGPWVDMANDNRMTIPAIVNLIMGQRESVQHGVDTVCGISIEDSTGKRNMQTALHKYPVYDPATGDIKFVQYGWTVLDMMGDTTPDVFNPKPALALNLVADPGIWALLKNIELGGSTLDDLLGGQTIDNLLYNGADILFLQIPAVYSIVDSLLSSVSYATGTAAVAGTPAFTDADDSTNSGWMYGFAPLTLKLTNSDGTTITPTAENTYYYGNVGDAATSLGIYANNASRGIIDYQRVAWVDSNGLLFAICGILSIRKMCYVFSGITVILMIVIGAIRLKLASLEPKKVSDDTPLVSYNEEVGATSVDNDYSSDYSVPDYSESEGNTEYYGSVGGNE